MKKIISLMIAFFVLFSCSVLALDFTPKANVNMQNRYNITNVAEGGVGYQVGTAFVLGRNATIWGYYLGSLLAGDYHLGFNATSDFGVTPNTPYMDLQVSTEHLDLLFLYPKIRDFVNFTVNAREFNGTNLSIHDYANITNLHADFFEGDNVDIENLNATNINAYFVNATSANITTIYNTLFEGDNIDASFINTTTLNATTIYNTFFEGDNVDVTNIITSSINATDAVFQNINVTNQTVINLNVTNIYTTISNVSVGNFQNISTVIINATNAFFENFNVTWVNALNINVNNLTATNFSFGTGTIVNLNVTQIYVTNLNASGDVNLNLNWTMLQNYPAPCPDGYFITHLGDNVTCKSANATVDLSNYYNKTEGNQTYLKSFQYPAAHSITDNATCVRINGSTTTFWIC